MRQDVQIGSGRAFSSLVREISCQPMPSGLGMAELYFLESVKKLVPMAQQSILYSLYCAYGVHFSCAIAETGFQLPSFLCFLVLIHFAI